MGRLIGLICVAVGFGFAIEMMPAGFYDRGLALVGHPTVRAAEAIDVRIGPSVASAPATPATDLARQPRVFAPTRPLIANAVLLAPASDHADAAAAARSPTTAPSDPTELARLLQIELRRVGCYTGDIDGSWGTGSRRAMQAFTERANSTLPIDAPDLVLLALVRNHGNATCSAECPAGQMMSSRGQCVKNPADVQASAVPGGWRPVVTVESRTVAAAPVQPIEPLRQTTVRRVTVAPAPQLVAGPVEAQRVEALSGTPAVSPARRDIDWGSRMSVGAGVGVPAILPQPQSSISTSPAPAALTPPASQAVDRSARSARQDRPVARPAPRQVQRPASIDRPRPASSWRRDAFASRN